MSDDSLTSSPKDAEAFRAPERMPITDAGGGLHFEDNVGGYDVDTQGIPSYEADGLPQPYDWSLNIYEAQKGPESLKLDRTAAFFEIGDTDHGVKTQTAVDIHQRCIELINSGLSIDQIKSDLGKYIGEKTTPQEF